jgi:hypothetical protein
VYSPNSRQKYVGKLVGEKKVRKAKVFVIFKAIYFLKIF